MEETEDLIELIKKQITIKDEMINKLHSKLDYYRQGVADRYTDQVMKAVIKVRKDMKNIIESAGWDELSKEDIKREYTYTFEDLTDLLEQQNIDLYTTEPGEQFDAAIHLPKLEKTNKNMFYGTIVWSISRG